MNIKQKISIPLINTGFTLWEMRACKDEFLATVTRGVAHSVYMVVTQFSFGVTWQHKVRGVNGCFATVSQDHI